jgi:hypothetical protein
VPDRTTRRLGLTFALLAASACGRGPAAPTAGSGAPGQPAGESLDVSGPLDPALAALGRDVAAAVSAGQFDGLEKYLMSSDDAKPTRAEAAFARELARARAEMGAGSAKHCATVLVHRTRDRGQVASTLHVSVRRDAMPSEFQFVVRVREFEGPTGLRLDDPSFAYTAPTCTGVTERNAHKDGIRVRLEWDAAKQAVIPTLDDKAYASVDAVRPAVEETRRGRRPAGEPLVPVIVDYDRRIPATDAYTFARKLTAPVQIVMLE